MAMKDLLDARGHTKGRAPSSRTASKGKGGQNARAESGHTPGPWIVRAGEIKESDRDTFEFLAGRVALISGKHWTDFAIVCVDADKAGDANARLIAAAPDLLAALKGLLAPEQGGVYASSDVIQAARAAIKKAEGAE